MSMLGRAVVGGAGLLITSASAIFGAFKFIEWSFGLATMPGNIDETQSTLAAFLKWLPEKDPNVAVLVAVGGLFLFGLLMMAWAIRRTQSAANPGSLGRHKIPSPLPSQLRKPDN